MHNVNYHLQIASQFLPCWRFVLAILVLTSFYVYGKEKCEKSTGILACLWVLFVPTGTGSEGLSPSSRQELSFATLDIVRLRSAVGRRVPGHRARFPDQ